MICLLLFLAVSKGNEREYGTMSDDGKSQVGKFHKELQMVLTVGMILSLHTIIRFDLGKRSDDRWRR